MTSHSITNSSVEGSSLPTHLIDNRNPGSNKQIPNDFFYQQTSASSTPVVKVVINEQAQSEPAPEEGEEGEEGEEEEEEEYDYEALPENTSLATNLMAGAAAGIMEHTVMYPVDVIKTRMQVATSKDFYSGIINAVSKISASEGAFSLWRGISSVVLGAGPAHAVYFAVFEYVKSTLGGSNSAHVHPLISAAAGASATTCSDALMNPFDVIKQRMQVNSSKYPSVFSCVRQIYATEGFKAFYVSYPTTLAMNVPFAAFNFMVYDTVSKALNPQRKYDPLGHCIAGGIAGASAAAITTPLDVAKTILQTRGINPSAETSNINSFFDATRYIYNKYGIAGFARGLRPRIVSNMPSTAISWTFYEMAKFYLYKNEMTTSKTLE